MGRPKSTNPKKKILSVTINIELDDLLNKLVEEKKISKSQYIEYLITKENKPIDEV
jgi:hypothetical protein